MLTEAEKDWLATREFFSCRRCEFGDECQRTPKGCDDFRPKEMWEDYLSAATFEARVAERLAKPRNELRPKGCSWYEKNADGHLVRKTACPPHHDIDNCPGVATCAIYHARLAAEAEMDNTAGSK